QKNGAVLFVLLSLICSVLSSYFEGNISANLVQTQIKLMAFMIPDLRKCRLKVFVRLSDGILIIK
ncbi:hypothetical protein BB024_10760, partial [Neisseria gonorrhoeae]